MWELKTTGPEMVSKSSRCPRESTFLLGHLIKSGFGFPFPALMRLFALLVPLLLLLANAAAQTPRDFGAALSQRVSALEKRNAAVATGVDGWLFLTSELRFLAQGRFWGDAAKGASRARRADAADPLTAIVDFHRQLKERGIELLLVPVPPKAEIYPDKLATDVNTRPAEAAPAMHEFYRELQSRGIDVLDLSEPFARNRDNPRGAVYCRTDSHWSGVGCSLAAEMIANQIRARVPSATPQREYAREWKEVTITGDLAALLTEGPKPPPERVAVRQLATAVQPDPNSPVLLLGDSHTLVFHEFLAERAGLLDQLTAELGYVPDLIGTRGSGATPVRVSMYRRSRSDPQFLAKKKLVVWCFAAREFTEADQGWVVQPIAR
jgi:alginate O-acetyltransferase complex protein AlgJ